VSKLPVSYFDRAYWEDGTKSGYRGYDRSWRLHRAIARYLRAILQPRPADRVLDWGGAFGYHVSMLAELTGCEPYLADGSPWAIDHCDPAVQGRCIQLDFGSQPLPWPDGHFASAIAIEVMEHLWLPEVGFALTELCRVVRPRGLLYASIATDFNTKRDHDLTHQTERPLSWWICRLVRAGFRLRLDLIDRAYQTVVMPAVYPQPLALTPGLRWNVIVAERRVAVPAQPGV
jgi:SAM-dependent methyltransferase